MYAIGEADAEAESAMSTTTVPVCRSLGLTWVSYLLGVLIIELKNSILVLTLLSLVHLKVQESDRVYTLLHSSATIDATILFPGMVQWIEGPDSTPTKKCDSDLYNIRPTDIQARLVTSHNQDKIRRVQAPSI